MKLCKELDVKVVDLFNALQKRDDWMNVSFTDRIHLVVEGRKIEVKKYFIHNYLAFTVKYHKDSLSKSSRIVTFEVKPFSIRHTYMKG